MGLKTIKRDQSSTCLTNSTTLLFKKSFLTSTISASLLTSLLLWCYYQRVILTTSVRPTLPRPIFGGANSQQSFLSNASRSQKVRKLCVARPSSNNCHSEEEIFGKYSVIDTPFYHLWSAYVERNGAYPKCILIYSWNLPCSRCTEAIIQVTGKKAIQWC